MGGTNGGRGPIEHIIDDLALAEVASQSGENDSGRDVAGEAVLRMCHDLVTPAVTIRNLAEAIEAEPGISPTIRRRAALIAAESNRVSEICAFTLDVVRETYPVRLDLIILECVESARSWFRGTIETEVDPVNVSAQRVPMLRLFANLLNNACQAAGPGGEVLITLGHDNRSANLEIVNTGAQLDPTSFVGPDGSANPSTLGFQIVAGILNDYHGRLRIKPRFLNGTTVQVQLPVEATSDQPTVEYSSGLDR